MAEDFDVEAMLEAPYIKSDDNSSSKHRTDKHSDRHRERDREGGRRRSRSKEKRRSRERDAGRGNERDDRRDKDRDDKRDRRDDRRDRDRDRDRRDKNHGQKDRDHGLKDKNRDRDHGKDRDRHRDRDSYKDKEKDSYKDKDNYREKEKERDKDKRKSKDKEREKSRERERSKDKSKKERSHEKEENYEAKILEPKLEELPPEERDLRTVFCMQLSQRIRAKDLEEFFSSVGKVRDVRLITCNKTRRFKGISYIEFKDAESVPLALGLTGQKLLGVPIIVQHTQAEKNRVGNTLPNLVPKANHGPTRLYVGSLHFNITEDMLRGIFEPFGKIDHIQLMTDTESGKSKGYGFLTFHNANDAKKAMEQLNGFELAGRPMKVGNVTERTDLGSGARFDADELDRAGVDLGATGRLQLMFKLAERTGLQIPAAAANMLMGGNSTLAAVAPQIAPPIATQCFMLNNMFSPSTETNPHWDIEIRDDVISECNKHGGVLHVYVDKASPQGNVYCKCPTIATAVASVNTLHGRWFAGRVITAAYVPLVTYHTMFPEAISALNLLLPVKPR